MERLKALFLRSRKRELSGESPAIVQKEEYESYLAILGVIASREGWSVSSADIESQPRGDGVVTFVEYDGVPPA